MQSRIDEQKKRADRKKEDWDKSTTVSVAEAKTSVEEKVAAQIATEMLKDNQKLRGVHSGASMKKIIEKEAKR